MNIQTITLDISKRSAVTPVLYLRQGDKSGTQLRVNVMRDGAAFHLGGYGVRFEMRAPKNRGYYECTGSANGNVATFTIDETYAAAFAGVTDVAYVRILEGSTVIASTGNFRVVIHEDGTEGADPNGAYTNGVTEWLEDATEQLNDVSGRAEAAIEAIGDISELAVPLMSTDVRGGAKLGHGLRISAERLGVQLVDGASGEASVGADGDYLHALAVHGKSVQDGTPTPDNPIEVRTVGGINLLDTINVFPKPTTTYQGCTITNNGDGTYQLSGTNSVGSPWGFTSSNGSLVLQAGTYTLSCSAVTGCSDLAIIASGGATVAATYVGESTTFTLAAATEIVSWRLVVAASAAIGGTFKCQLERGTTAHDFVPYGALGLKVKGKNRLPKFVPGIYAQSGITIEVNDDNVVHFKGTVTSTSLNFTIPLESTVPIDMTNMYIHVRNSVPVSAATSIVLQPTTAAVNGSAFTFEVRDKIVAATSAMISQLNTVGSARIYSPIGTVLDFSLRMSIEAGSTATEYAPYLDSVTPIPLNGNVLASLPDGTHDELAIDDAGHAVIEKIVGVYEYDGSNDETWHTEYNSTYGMINFYIGAPLSKRTTVNLLCNMSMRGTAATTQPPGLVFVSNTGNANFPFGNRIGITDTSTALADFRTWLATHIMYLHYPLATPQEIDLGYIDMPKLSEGSTIELLATIDPPIDAEWWAVGAGAVHEAAAAQSERIAALESAIAELATS